MIATNGRGAASRGLRRAAFAALALFVAPSGWSQVGAPSRAATLLATGERAFAAGEFRIAVRNLSQYLSLAPTAAPAPRADHLLGISYYYDDQLVLARAQLEAHRARYPRSEYLGDVDYWLGMVAAAEGRTAAAIEQLASFRSSASASELYSYATDALASQFEIAGEPAAALELYRELIRLAATGGEATQGATEVRLPGWLRRAGSLELSLGMAPAAAARFARILDEFADSPQAASALFLLAEASYLAGDRPAALSRFRRYATLFVAGEYRAAALYRLASSAADEGNASEAARLIDELDAALPAAPAGAAPPAFDLAMLRGQVAGLRGQALAAAGAYAEAGRVAEAAGDRGGEQRAAFARAEALVAADDDDEAALSLFLRAADGPDQDYAAHALYNAAALSAAGDRAEAAVLLQRLLQQYPGSVLRDEAEALLLRVTTDGDSALRLQVLDRIATRRQLSAEEHRMRGVALVASGHERDGLQVLSGARDRSEALYAVGAVYASRGEHMRAAGLFDQVAATGDRLGPAEWDQPANLPSEELRARAGLAAAIARFNTGAYREVVAWAAPVVAAMQATPHGAEALWEAETRLLLAAAYSRLGDEAAAADEYGRATDAAARGAGDAGLWQEAATRQAWSLFRDGQLAAAEDAFVSLAAAGVDPGSNLYRAGLAASRAGRAGDGIAHLTASAARLAPEAALHPALLYELAAAQLQRGHLDAANRTLDQLERGHPEHQLTLIAGLRRAEILGGRGALEEAEHHALAVASGANGRWPGLAEQARYLAMTVADERSSATALARAWELVTQHPATSRRDEAVAVVAAWLAGAGAAEVRYYYRQALAEEVPPELAATVHLAFARELSVSDPPAAIAALEAALTLTSPSRGHPVRRQAQLLMAQLWERTGELEWALRVYGGLTLDPASPLAGQASLGAARIEAMQAESSEEAAQAADTLAAVAFHFAADLAIAAEAWQLAAAAAERAGEEERAGEYRVRAHQARRLIGASE